MLVSALAPDAILALHDPPLVAPDHTDAEYVEDTDRVVGFELNGAPVAVPLNVLRFHEVVNFSAEGVPVAATFCPLTGSSLVFDRSGVDGVPLRVSGLLHHNNLVMFDRRDDSSLFTQMRTGAATCGPRAAAGQRLILVPSVEMRWDAWRRLHPGTRIVSEQTGGLGDYRVNPHAEYEQPDNHQLLVAMEIDPRRPPKERVLGIPTGGDGGPAFPFGELDRAERAAVPVRQGSIVVLWDRGAEAARAFSTAVAGHVLTLEPTDTGWTDQETGSAWDFRGVSISGPLEGARLAPVEDAFVSFWFAWAAFYPETVVWEGG